MFAPLSKGYLTQGFTDDHKAIDIGWISYLILNPNVYAWRDGTVVESTFQTLGGNVIAIKHDVGADHYYLTRYVHLKSRAVSVGMKVVQGSVLGVGGKTGQTSDGKPVGTHLHFEIWVCPKDYVYKSVSNADRNKYAVDPRCLISTTMKGDLFRMVNLTPSNMPYASTPYADTRFRDLPGLKSIVLGALPKGVRIAYLGKTNSIDGYEWAKLLLDDRIVYAAAKFLTVVEPTKEVIKEVIKEVERPIDVFGDLGDFHITIQRGAK